MIIIIIIIKTILSPLLLSILQFVSPSWMCSVLNVQSSMFNVFLAHLLGAYAKHVPVALPVVWCKTLKIFFSETAQKNSYILHTNSLWVCVIKVCSNGGATYIISEIIAKDNLNIENLMQTFENLLLQTCTFTKWKLILSNNEDNNNNIDINNNKNNNDNNNNNKNNSVTSSVINSWICFTFLNVFSVKCSSMFNFFFSSPVESLCHTCTRGKPKCSEFHVKFFFLAHLLRAYAIHVPVASSVVWWKPLKIFFSKTAQQNSYILHTYIHFYYDNPNNS